MSPQAGEREGRSPAEREAKMAGLQNFQTPTLESVERRRWQLWGMAALLMIVLALAVVALSFGFSPFEVSFLPTYVIRILFLSLIIGLALYLVDKESRLRKLTRALLDERVLSAALSNRLKELSILSEVGKAINQVLDLHDVLRMILRSAVDLLNAEEGTIMLVDEEQGDLVVAFAQSPKAKDLEGIRVKMGEGIAGWVAEHREALLISGKAKQNFFKVLLPRERPVSSAVSVPLIGQGELYGVLNVNDVSGKRDFAEYDLRALGLFAEHAAIAIRNARTYEQEKNTVTRLAEVDRMKSEFVATVSHELRSPLTSMIGCAQTVRRRSAELGPAQTDEFLEMIETQGARLLEMVEQMLTASHLESGRSSFIREEIDLAQIARDTVKGFKAAGGTHPIDVDAPQSAHIFGDPSATVQVLTNLLDNAIKYSDDHTPVTVKVTDSSTSASLAVSDVGRGISEENLLTIFERFRQIDGTDSNAKGGVGLGLYIVKSLVEGQGATINVSSQEGKGSTFIVTYPKRTR